VREELAEIVVVVVVWSLLFSWPLPLRGFAAAVVGLYKGSWEVVVGSVGLSWVMVEGDSVLAVLVLVVVVATLYNQPGTLELDFEDCPPPSSFLLLSTARGSFCDEAAASGRESADPISVRVSERARTCIEGATAGTWPVGERFLLFSARRSSTIVLSSSTSFSTSESSALPAELFDWFERLRCRRGVFRVDRWSTSVEWLDELLRSRACCRREFDSDGDGALAFAGESLTAGEGA
jgi:hypothetical protein